MFLLKFCKLCVFCFCVFCLCLCLFLGGSSRSKRFDVLSFYVNEFHNYIMLKMSNFTSQIDTNANVNTNANMSATQQNVQFTQSELHRIIDWICSYDKLFAKCLCFYSTK